jgi:hypothetical protein
VSTRRDIVFQAGPSRVLLACTFSDAGDLVDFEVVPEPVERDENAARLAKRLTLMARRVREDGLGACVAEAFFWWQLFEKLQLIQRQHDDTLRAAANQAVPCARP